MNIDDGREYLRRISNVSFSTARANSSGGVSASLGHMLSDCWGREACCQGLKLSLTKTKSYMSPGNFQQRVDCVTFAKNVCWVITVGRNFTTGLAKLRVSISRLWRFNFWVTSHNMSQRSAGKTSTMLCSCSVRRTRRTAAVRQSVPVGPSVYQADVRAHKSTITGVSWTRIVITRQR